MNKIKVPNFWLQKTASYPDGAPQREEYLTDRDFDLACAEYDREWLDTYECMNTDCKNQDCPQHHPIDYAKSRIY